MIKSLNCFESHVFIESFKFELSRIDLVETSFVNQTPYWEGALFRTNGSRCKFTNQSWVNLPNTIVIFKISKLHLKIHQISFLLSNLVHRKLWSSGNAIFNKFHDWKRAEIIVQSKRFSQQLQHGLVIKYWYMKNFETRTISKDIITFSFRLGHSG